MPNNSPPQPAGRSKLHLILGPIFASVVLAGAFLFLPDLLDRQDSKSFDKNLWLNSPSARMAMSQDMLQNHIRIGMKEGEVDLLLGKPDIEVNEKAVLDTLILPGHHAWQYWIGDGPLGEDEPVFLYILFDENAEVLGSELRGN